MNEEEDNLSEEGLEDPYESALKKAIEAQKKRIEAQKDDLTEGKIKRKRTGEEDIEEEEEGDGFLDPESGFRTTLAIGTEVGLNTLLDLLSADPTQLTQVIGSQGINYFAQRIRGGEFSQGEMVAAGIASLIPGAAQAKSVAGGIARTAGRGAVSGAIETGAADLIDTGEIDPDNVIAGAGVGGAFGGIFGAAATSKEGKALIKGIRRRLKGGDFDGDEVAKFTADELEEMGIGQPMESRFADELTPTTASSLQNELDTRAVGDTYGFQYTNVSSKPRKNRYGIPKDINTVYLNHADAYRAAMGPDDTLELFPTLIWNGKRYRPKSRGKGQGVSFEDLLDRQTRRKISNERRALAVWKQTRPGVKPGTFYRTKLKQLRQLNTLEQTLGLPENLRTKLRDVDMDHKNALRSVEDYTEGLTDPATKRVYDLMEQGGLFTGDDARNLILRNRIIHKNVWPRMKEALAALGHLRRKDFRTQAEYMRYLTKSQSIKTGDSPIQEYIDTINFIEEQATLEAEELLANKVRELYSKVPGAKRTAAYKRLSEILGGDDNVDALVQRLERDAVPTDIRPDLLRGEFEYIGSFGPVSDAELDDIIDELTK